MYSSSKFTYCRIMYGYHIIISNYSAKECKEKNYDKLQLLMFFMVTTLAAFSAPRVVYKQNRVAYSNLFIFQHLVKTQIPSEKFSSFQNFLSMLEHQILCIILLYLEKLPKILARMLSY